MRTTWMAVLLAGAGILGTQACSSESASPGPGKTTGLDVGFGSGDGSTSSDGGVKDSGVSDGGLSDGSLSDGIGSDSAETTINSGEFNSPCVENSDCLSGFCIASAAGKVCSQVCVDTCPDGWTCQQVASGSDTAFICKPRFDALCDPCGSTADCNPAGGVDNVCISYGGDGSFCGAMCNPAKTDCPGGYACQQVTDPATGKNTYQCAPLSNQCSCSKTAQASQKQTACWHTNVLGKCTGVRKCGPNGLGDCDALVPAEESCNGVDDNCDGITDENLAGGKCTKKNAFGTCAGVAKACVNGVPDCDAAEPKLEACNGLDDDCNGLTDDGVCNDGNACTKDSCNPDGSCKNDQQAGLACDDGNACTQSDACAAGSCVGGGVQTCDDNNPCTNDNCDPNSGCIHINAIAGATCPDDGDTCTSDTCDGAGTCKHIAGQGLCSINGQCIKAGTVNPANPCQVCNPLQSTTAFVEQNGLPCDDSDLCTTGDKCQGGVCKGAPMDCTAKDGACAKGTCSNGICSAQPKAGLCTDNDACTLNDVCIDGVCKGIPKDCSGLDDTCYIGSCQAGQCTQQPKLGSCDDGDPCTTGDSCAGGGCKGKPLDCTSLNSACGTGMCVNGQCVAKALNSGILCDDGNPCTSGDTCTAGMCVGTPKNCSGLDGVCQSGVCQGGQCFTQPKNGGCDDSNSCTVNDACNGGQCKGAPMDCSANSSACGISVCQNGACTLPIGGQCSPGQNDTQSQACGNCGTQTRSRSCTGGCTWGGWSAWGACNGQGACAAGATQSQGCGNCGTQTRTCNGSCQWGGWGGCGGAGPCAPGATQACGDTSASCKQNTCNGSCQWGSCDFKPGASCEWNKGSNYKCCGTHKWQFCSSSCNYFSCAAESGAPWACP